MSKQSGSALTDALEIQQRAAAVGFDWADAKGPREKITEELAELDDSVRHSRAGGNPVKQSGVNAKVAEELGDLLFAVVNLARHLKVEPEQALAAANEKFQRRFRYIEGQLATQGLQPGDVDLARLGALWDEAKCHESDS